MVLNNIKKLQKDHGFTIVELLVVIVVIGILASITIVSYTGITQKANTTKAQSNAASVQSVAEIYANENTVYPVTTGAFASTTAAKLPTGVTIALGMAGTIASPTGTNTLAALGTTDLKTTTVTWACSGGTAAAGNCAGNTGGKITYWDFTTGLVSTNVLYVGAATSASTFFTPAS